MRKTVKMTKLKSNQKGITLIALVITIIVLLILAGVAITMLSGENGILRQAANAKTQTEEQSTLEKMKLGALAAMTHKDHTISDEGELLTALQQQGLDITEDDINETKEGYKVTANGIIQIITNNGNVRNESEVEKKQGKVLNQNGNTPVKDEYGNTIMVPAGFAITKDASKVEDGIVITDSVDANGDSIGNEFVWIPVNDVKTSKGTKTVTLGRYGFTTKGEAPIVQSVTTEDEAIIAVDPTQAISIAGYYEVTPDNETVLESTYQNVRAKSLEGFLKSTVKNGGYYIARYEAGISGAKDNYNLSTSTSVTGAVKPQSKKGLRLWNDIRQKEASAVSQAMYTNSNFTSDLINSYAWDTAIVFIQTMKDGFNYANLKGNSETSKSEPQTTGTNILKQTLEVDVQCNIYDMAGNLKEWSTETYKSPNKYCVARGSEFGFTGYDGGTSYRTCDDGRGRRYVRFPSNSISRRLKFNNNTIELINNNNKK